MKILLIKMSSLGDIIHVLPALTDASQAISSLKITWVVEEAFREIPLWHSVVDSVIPIALRRWRKHPIKAFRTKEWQNFYKNLRTSEYDYVIDAQGLMKSAAITCLARGLRCGLNWSSAWENLACLAYQKKVAVDPNQHAITRMRILFSKILDYPLPDQIPQYNLNLNLNLISDFNFIEKPYVLFLHGTTWKTKLWPTEYWIELAEKITHKGYRIGLPFGNEEEKVQAENIAKVNSNYQILPKLNLTQLAYVISSAKAVVTVDSGLGHLSAALNVPTIGLYGPTDLKQTGVWGEKAISLQSDLNCSPCEKNQCTLKGNYAINPPCFESLNPMKVFKVLENYL